MTPEQLVTDNIGLARFVANKYRPSMRMMCCDYEDLVSIAKIGLVKAANAYDASKGTKFATLAVLCMHNELKMAHNLASRKGRKDVVVASLNQIVADDVNTVEMLDTIAADVDVLAEVERRDDIRHMWQMIERLPARDRRIMQLMYADGATQQAAASEVGLSQSYASRRVRAIQTKAKEMMTCTT